MLKTSLLFQSPYPVLPERDQGLGVNVDRKRLCVIVPTHWAARMGGSQYQAKILIDLLLSTGRYEIFYLASRINPTFRPDGYQIIRIAERKGYRRHGFFFDAPKLLAILRELEPDVIYQRVGCAYTGIAAYYARSHHCEMVWHIAHDRNVLSFEGGISPNLPFRYLERRILDYGIAHADHIVAQTERQKDILEARYGRSASVIPNFHPAPTEAIVKEGPIKVVWVANLKSWKRPELFVKLADDLRYLRDVEFIMIGADQQDDHELTHRMAQLDNLNYLGACSQDTVNAILAKSHIFVNTSRYEGFANTFIQAWMRRVPVVSLDVDPDEILTRETIGFFSNGSYETLRQQVMTLIEQEGLRDTMGRKAENYALTHYSERNVQRLREIFDG